MRFFRILKKILSWILITAVILISATTISIFIYKDRLIQHLIRVANQHITTPIHIDDIDINTWDKFPNISLSLHNVLIEESWSDSSDPLLRAQNIYIILNPFDLVVGKLEINAIHIENASCYIRVDKNGRKNYAIFKDGGNGKNDSLNINLKKITLSETAVHYLDYRSNQDHRYYTAQQNASIQLKNNIYKIHSSGNLRIDHIKIKGLAVVTNKSFSNITQLSYNNKNQTIKIAPSEIILTNSRFTVSGTIALEDDRNIQLDVKGVDTNIQTLLSLLPEDKTNKFLEYKSKGNVYFQSTISGRIGNKMAVIASFGMKNATITHPGSNIRIDDMNVDGNLTIHDFTHPESILLDLKTIKGKIGNHAFEGSLRTENFTSPFLQFTAKGTLEVSDLLKLIPQKNVVKGSGSLSGSIKFEGYTKDIRSIYTIDKVNAGSSLQLDSVSLTFTDDYPPVTTMSGKITYTQHNLEFKDATVSVGSSHWKMEGSLRNLLPYFVSDDQSIQVRAEITEGNVNLDELLPTSGYEGAQRHYSLSGKLNLDVDCQLDRLNYKRFHAKDLQGNIKINKQKAFVKDLSFRSMGGKLLFNSLISFQNDRIEITNTTNFEGIDIDSVFYVYQNFGQDWLVAENLKGKVYADVMTDMAFSQDLTFYPESLVADIAISIESGELNDFEPMRRLEKYVDDDNLSSLQFSDLKNDIHVENRTIYLPKMEVRSNVSNISISGTHTFDQQILYHVVVPVRSLGKQKDKDAFGAVEDDGSGSKLYLIISGTTSDYEISYDSKAVGRKIVSDLRKEVKELKDAFKKKDKKAEEITLEEDEYFEWDVDTTSYKLPRIPFEEVRH